MANTKRCAPGLGLMELVALRRSWAKAAWEMGPLVDPFPGLPAPQMWAVPPLAAAVAARPMTSTAALAIGGKGDGRGVLTGTRRRSGPPPGQADAKEREAAVAKWVKVLEILREFGALTGKSRDLAFLVEECAAVKATQTLHLRAGSWLMYLKWAKDQEYDPFPLKPEVVEKYLREAAVAAATRGSRFLEAVAFAQYVFGLDVECAFTARARGIAATGLKRKRLVRQAAPFTKGMVLRWENQVVEAAKAPEEADLIAEIFRGHILWVVHARARFGDSARIRVEPWLDVVEGEGYIESYAQPGEYKTGHGLKKVGRKFPVVGWATGVSGLPWARAWLKLRAAAGCDAEVDGTLMPEILAAGEFGSARMKTQDAGLILYSMLAKDGIQEVKQFGAHSAKATLLSWAAKAGLSRSDRRLLGGHSDSRDKSMEGYSRDVLAKPLKSLADMLEQVRTGRFEPDATRSGRWTTPKAIGGQPDDSTGTKKTSEEEMREELDEQAEGEDQQVGSVDAKVSHELEQCEEQAPVAAAEDEDPFGELTSGESVPSSESSDTSSDDEASGEEAEAEKATQDVCGTGAGYPQMPTGGIWLGSARGCIHRGLGQDTPHSACGYGLKWVTAWWSCEWPEGVHPLCKRTSCFPARG